MRAGGKVAGNLWTTRAHSLRPGDYVKCTHWSGEMWTGGETLLVIEEPVRAPKTEYRPAGYYDIKVQVPDDPKNWRVLCIRGEDVVQLTAREVVEKREVTPKPKKQPKATQLKLFDD